MEPIHPLASDHDASADAAAASEAICALSLGRLDGLLNGLSAQEKRLFCWALLRDALLCALTQAGFSDAELRFDAWFAGIDRGPAEAPDTTTPPQAIVRAILAELSHHAWEPLAEAARLAQRMGRFPADRDGVSDGLFAADALIEAGKLAQRAADLASSPLPFPALIRFVDLARMNPQFSNAERETRMLNVDGRMLHYEQRASRSPLWALDLAVSHVLSANAVWHIALPCPGAFTSGLLRPELWPRERRVVVSEAIGKAATRLIRLADTARQRASAMARALGGLRCNSRAPEVWMAAISFAPLGLDQVSKGFGLSRRGVYTISDTLVAAGLLSRKAHRGMVVLSGQQPRSDLAVLPTSAPSDMSPAVESYNDAMSEIDRLLERASNTAPKLRSLPDAMSRVS